MRGKPVVRTYVMVPRELSSGEFEIRALLHGYIAVIGGIVIDPGSDAARDLRVTLG
jgi:hypothetical protein